MIEEDAHKGICVYEETIARQREMTPKMAIEELRECVDGECHPDYQNAIALAISALSVCDELGLLDE